MHRIRWLPARQAGVSAEDGEGCDLAEYRLEDVDVRQYGDVALVRATGHWRAKDGKPGVSRYVDVYVRSDDDWRVVSAQITRPAAVS